MEVGKIGIRIGMRVSLDVTAFIFPNLFVTILWLKDWTLYAPLACHTSIRGKPCIAPPPPPYSSLERGKKVTRHPVMCLHFLGEVYILYNRSTNFSYSLFLSIALLTVKVNRNLDYSGLKCVMPEFYCF